MIKQLSEDEYEDIMSRVDTSEEVSLDDARNAVDWMCDEGLSRYPNMTAHDWLCQIQDLLAEVGR